MRYPNDTIVNVEVEGLRIKYDVVFTDHLSIKNRIAYIWLNYTNNFVSFMFELIDCTIGLIKKM